VANVPATREACAKNALGVLPGINRRSVSTHMDFQQEQQDLAGQFESLDGDGAGDHDQPYRFGWRPRASVPYPFNTRQYARLLVFRSRIEERLARQDDLDRAA
jgi:hypothetical protein